MSNCPDCTPTATPAADAPPLPWEAAWEPWRGLMAELLDFACDSSSPLIAQAYCYLAQHASAAKVLPDESVAVFAGNALAEVAKALAANVETALDSQDVMALTHYGAPRNAQAIRLCAQLQTLVATAAARP